MPCLFSLYLSVVVRKLFLFGAGQGEVVICHILCLANWAFLGGFKILKIVLLFDFDPGYAPVGRG